MDEYTLVKDTGKYLIKEKEVDMGGGLKEKLVSCYNYQGAAIGDIRMAVYICEEMGIVPEVIPGDTVCRIGFRQEDNKWYGWSHRAITGFGIGDRVLERSFEDGDNTRPKIKTLDEAKEEAIKFAKSVA